MGVIEFEVGDRVLVKARAQIDEGVRGNPGWVNGLMGRFCEREFTIVDIGKEYYGEGHIALLEDNDPSKQTYWFHRDWIMLVNGSMTYASFELVNEYRKSRGEERLGTPVKKKKLVPQSPWL